MGLDELRVNHKGLDSMAESMDVTVKNIIKRLNQLETDSEKYRKDWDGDQSAAYDTAKAAWDWAMQEMHELLDGAKNTVYQSNADYMGADKRGANAFGDI